MTSSRRCFANASPRRMEGQFWLSFVQAAEWEVLDSVLDAIAQNKELQRRIDGRSYISIPTLAEVKLDYGRAQRLSRENRKRQQGIYGACNFCGGNGYVFVLTDEHGWAIDVTKPFKSASLCRTSARRLPLRNGKTV